MKAHNAADSDGPLLRGAILAGTAVLTVVGFFAGLGVLGVIAVRERRSHRQQAQRRRESYSEEDVV